MVCCLRFRNTANPMFTAARLETSMKTVADDLDEMFSTGTRALKGVGPKTEETMVKMGISTIRDLLLHLPTKIVDRTQLLNLSLSQDGVSGMFEVRYVGSTDPQGKRPGTLRMRQQDGTPLSLVYFSSAGMWFSLKKSMLVDKSYWVFGKVGIDAHGERKIFSPPILIEASEENRNKTFQIDVEYSSTEGISSTKLKSFISLALNLLGKRFNNLTDWLDAEVATSYRWPTLISAIMQVHNPLTLEDLHPRSSARQRIAFEELTSTVLRLRLERLVADADVGQNFSIISPKNWQNILREKILDFNMTQCQLNAIQTIQSDLESNMRMVRLLQGDVGTGKTIVAAHAILHVVETGRLCVVLAPTEILAEQHYAILSGYFKNIKNISDIEHYSSPISNQSVVLLLGGSKFESRREIFTGIIDGSVKVIVGTHALLSDEFIQILQKSSRLGLVVIDEEQRFGVNQRDKLAKLSNVLFTTATPIPRSLSLVVQESISISTLVEAPPTRRKTETIILEQSAAKQVIDRIEANIPFGTKVFWVTPTLYPSSNFPESSASERFEQLKTQFPGLVGLIHGDLPSFEKHLVLERFRKGDIQVLVTTTVIEVGVDVPDASICVIDNANRFGLSQIHQIRGRVGRGARPKDELLENAYCILLNGNSNTDKPEACPTRLNILRDVKDGFKIAEADLEIRGPGDFFGSDQHGLSSLKFASISTDVDLLEESKIQVTHMLTLKNAGDSQDNDIISYICKGLFPFVLPKFA